MIKGLGLDRYPQLLNTLFCNYQKLIYLAQSDNPDLKTNRERRQKAQDCLNIITRA
ncbi:MAG: hypothetical protein R2880_10630 [Deinococcales bacterium]